MTESVPVLTLSAVGGHQDPVRRPSPTVGRHQWSVGVLAATGSSRDLSSSTVLEHGRNVTEGDREALTARPKQTQLSNLTHLHGQHVQYGGGGARQTFSSMGSCATSGPNSPHKVPKIASRTHGPKHWCHITAKGMVTFNKGGASSLQG